ncbi:MAG: hypothetical protein QXL54_03165 [Candidatus Bathyarchaeia archaeon]
MNRNDKILIAVLAALIVGFAFAIGLAYIYVLRIPTTGKVKTVGVQLLDVYGNPITTIDWGTIAPGETVQLEALIYNNGSVPVTVEFATEDWSPENAQNFIALTWNYTGTVINPAQSCPVTFTLTISPEIAGIEKFSFAIALTALEV